jgi:threonylcarbamoyladenosine tRNA methylthiotransferase MtaB
MKVFLDSVGCRLNQSEIESIAKQFRAAGHHIVGNAGEADLVVVNTCAVTAEAASDSRQKIRQAARAGAGQIVVTGCWATLDASAAAGMERVQWVIPNGQKDQLAAEVTGLPTGWLDKAHLARQILPGAHQRTRAFIKIQDGCDNHCTFCITRLARGASRSRPAGQVIADIQAALQGGAQEIVLTGVQLGSWGRDLGDSERLSGLLGLILNQTGVKRLRLSSLEPWDVDETLLAMWQNPRLCRHLHLPLQSGSGATLRRMGRRTSPDDYARLVEQMRAWMPDIAVTTDIIVGFPGETEIEFNQSLEFVRRMGFAGGHVFTYSARAGTPAACFPDQIPHPVRKERNGRLRAVLAESGRFYRQKFSGKILPVLWEARTVETPQGVVLWGLTGNYIRVEALANQAMWNQISQVRLGEVLPDGMRGEIIDPGDEPAQLNGDGNML